MIWFTARFSKATTRRAWGRKRAIARNILAALSLLFCLAIIALMFRSNETRDAFALPLGPYRASWIQTTRDGIQFIYRTSSRPEDHGRGWTSSNQPEGLSVPTRLGFGYYHTHGWYIRDYSGTRLIGVKIVTVPDYLLILLSAILPTIWALKRVPELPKCAQCRNALPTGAIFCPACKTPTASAPARTIP